MANARIDMRRALGGPADCVSIRVWSGFMEESILNDNWEEVLCIHCGGGAKLKVIWPDIEYGDIVRCCKCKLIYRSPRRDGKYVSRYFEKDIEPLMFEESRSHILKMIANWLLSLRPHPGTVLDIGASSGYLLGQFPSKWRRFGVEPSKTACELARTRVPDATFTNELFGAAVYPVQFFDVITMIDASYYLSHPLRELAKVRDLLKPNGIFLLESPNFNNRAFVYRLTSHRFAPTWMYFYVPKTLKRVVEAAGLRIIDRWDLPGNRISSRRWSTKLTMRLEFQLTGVLRKLTYGSVDLVPHFAFLANRADIGR